MMNAVVVAALAISAATAPRTSLWHKPELAHAHPATKPMRIVSLAPVVTETLFLFGAGDRVVGDTRFCDRPEAAKNVSKVGGYVDISLEAVLGLKPDLVVAMPSLGQRDVLDRLRERGVPVLVVFGDDSSEIHDMIKKLGAVLDVNDAAQKTDRALTAAENALAALKLPADKRVAVVVGTDPLVVAGPDTFAGAAVARSGIGSAVPKDAPMWPVWSAESLAASHVDILLAANGPDDKAKLEALVARAFPSGQKPAVVSSSRPILMRPGPSLVDDLPELGRVLSAAVQR
jgi:iron complex transport system substrate-binding protein